MSLKIRLARGGAKKRPHYRIVVADVASPRDGRFIEKIGTWNPILPKEHAERVKIDADRAKHWLRVGAKPTDRVARFLDGAGLMKRDQRNNPKKALPGKKRTEREKAEAEASSEEAAKAETEAPAEAPAEVAAEAPAEAPSEETAAQAPVAEEAAEGPAEAAAEAPAEEAAAEAPAEETTS